MATVTIWIGTAYNLNFKYWFRPPSCKMATAAADDTDAAVRTGTNAAVKIGTIPAVRISPITSVRIAMNIEEVKFEHPLTVLDVLFEGLTYRHIREHAGTWWSR